MGVDKLTTDEKMGQVARWYKYLREVRIYLLLMGSVADRDRALHEFSLLHCVNFLFHNYKGMLAVTSYPWTPRKLMDAASGKTEGVMPPPLTLPEWALVYGVFVSQP